MSSFIDLAPQRIVVGDVTLSVRVDGPERGPLCILVHGWPELGLSWRHQVKPLTEAGFRVAVPDVRGFGDSDCPPDVDAYSMTALVGDVMGLADALGYDDMVLVGHDWGAPIVWNASLLHPKRVNAVVGMSVPHLSFGNQPPVELLRAAYHNRFFYILYFQQPNTPEAEFERDIRDALTKIYWMNSADATSQTRAEMRARTRHDGYLDGISLPDQLPRWLTKTELDAYVRGFTKSGFRGGLHRYRNMDSDWHALRHLADAKIEPPACFICGEFDSVLRYAPGANLLDLMDPFYANLQKKVIIQSAGHWVQQEQPEQVNAALLEFLSP